MSGIQQGTGHGFNSNGKSFTINVDQPWVDYCDVTAPPPDPLRPIQFQVDITNTASTPADPPEWYLQIVNGVILTTPVSPSKCINAEWANEIDAACDPYNGSDSNSYYTNLGGGIKDPDTSTEVYLFRITTDGTSTFILWVGPTADYTAACPVVLPDNITPEGDYEAQALHVAGAYLVEGEWTINQVLQGTITFPDAIDNLHPFKVLLKSPLTDSSNPKYTVVMGTVNNLVPTNMTDEVEVDISHDNFIWVAAGHGSGTPGDFPDPANLLIAVDTAVPSDSDTLGYVGIAKIDAGTGKIHQLVTGSLWSARLKLGTATARYLWSRI